MWCGVMWCVLCCVVWCVVMTSDVYMNILTYVHMYKCRVMHIYIRLYGVDGEDTFCVVVCGEGVVYGMSGVRV